MIHRILQHCIRTRDHAYITYMCTLCTTHACSEGGSKGGPLILQLRVPLHNCNISINKLRVPLKGVLKGALKGLH